MRESRSDRLFKAFTIFIVLLITASCLFPFLYIVSVSFSNKTAVMRSEVFLWPVDIDFSAYKSVFGNRSLMTAMWFTIGLTVVPYRHLRGNDRAVRLSAIQARP